ncbi:MAG: hypothetical protein ACLS6O_00400 [Bifidobacterium sp.]
MSAYTHGCSFMTISGDGDDIRITPRAADWSSALWDWGNDRIGAAMTIRDKDKDGYITRFDVWLPGKVYLCRRNSGTWEAERIETGFDQPTVVPIISDQQLYRPSAPAASPAHSWPSPTSDCAPSCAWKRPQNSTRHHASGSSEPTKDR